MAGGEVFERMEPIAGAEDSASRPLRQRLVHAVLLVAPVVLLGYLLYVAEFSGTVRWLLGFAVIAVLSLYAWHAVAQGTREPMPMVKPQPLGRARLGELEVLTGVVRRANQGLPYSQVAVSSRARDAFEERARLARGWSTDAMRGLERDVDGLQAMFHDPILEDFLHLPSADSDERYRWVWATRAGVGFEVAMGRVLDRMEGWR